MRLCHDDKISKDNYSTFHLIIYSKTKTQTLDNTKGKGMKVKLDSCEIDPLMWSKYLMQCLIIRNK